MVLGLSLVWFLSYAYPHPLTSVYSFQQCGMKYLLYLCLQEWGNRAHKTKLCVHAKTSFVILTALTVNDRVRQLKEQSGYMIDSSG